MRAVTRGREGATRLLVQLRCMRGLPHYRARSWTSDIASAVMANICSYQNVVRFGIVAEPLCFDINFADTKCLVAEIGMKAVIPVLGGRRKLRGTWSTSNGCLQASPTLCITALIPLSVSAPPLLPRKCAGKPSPRGPSSQRKPRHPISELTRPSTS